MESVENVLMSFEHLTFSTVFSWILNKQTNLGLGHTVILPLHEIILSRDILSVFSNFVDISAVIVNSPEFHNELSILV